MLEFISLFMVVVYSIYFFLRFRMVQTNSLSRCAPMLLGMTGSVTIGLIAGVLFPDLLAFSTILSIVISAGIAFLIGIGFGMNGLIEAQSSSLMGAMMGAMLGVMLSANEIVFVIISIDMIYLLNFYWIHFLLEKHTTVPKQSNLKKNLLTLMHIGFLFSICLTGLMGMIQTDDEKMEEEIIPHHHHDH